MLPVAALVGFCLAVVPVVVAPGASFTLVSARGLAGDRRGAWATIAGTAAGILTHAVLAGAGLAALVMRSAQAYSVIRLLGALCLVVLGLGLLRQGLRSRPDAATGESPSPRSVRPWPQVGRAYAANVLNVKAASVYLTLAPQLLPARAVSVGAMLQLGLVHVVVMAAWLGVWAAGLTSLTGRWDPRRWRRGIDSAGGAVLVALGVRTAVQGR